MLHVCQNPNPKEVIKSCIQVLCGISSLLNISTHTIPWLPVHGITNGEEFGPGSNMHVWIHNRKVQDGESKFISDRHISIHVVLSRGWLQWLLLDFLIKGGTEIPWVRGFFPSQVAGRLNWTLELKCLGFDEDVNNPCSPWAWGSDPTKNQTRLISRPTYE